MGSVLRELGQEERGAQPGSARARHLAGSAFPGYGAWTKVQLGNSLWPLFPSPFKNSLICILTSIQLERKSASWLVLSVVPCVQYICACPKRSFYTTGASASFLRSCTRKATKFAKSSMNQNFYSRQPEELKFAISKQEWNCSGSSCCVQVVCVGGRAAWHQFSFNVVPGELLGQHGVKTQLNPVEREISGFYLEKKKILLWSALRIKILICVYAALFWLYYLKIENQYLGDGEAEAQKGKVTCREDAEEASNTASNWA